MLWILPHLGQVTELLLKSGGTFIFIPQVQLINRKSFSFIIKSPTSLLTCLSVSNEVCESSEPLNEIFDESVNPDCGINPEVYPFTELKAFW